MEQRRRKKRAVTLVCCGISGVALVLGMWIAAAPFASGTDFNDVGPIALMEVR